MTVWLVAEDRVQIIQADRVTAYSVVPEKENSAANNPVDRILSGGAIRILAGTEASRDAEAFAWTALLTFDGGSKDAVHVLQELAQTLDKATEQGRARTVFVHGPLPKLRGPARSGHAVWQISDELPVKDWPHAGNLFRRARP